LRGAIGVQSHLVVAFDIKAAVFSTAEQIAARGLQSMPSKDRLYTQRKDANAHSRFDYGWPGREANPIR
jgi:hypothetical protein